VVVAGRAAAAAVATAAAAAAARSAAAAEVEALFPRVARVRKEVYLIRDGRSSHIRHNNALKHPSPTTLNASA